MIRPGDMPGEHPLFLWRPNEHERKHGRATQFRWIDYKPGADKFLTEAIKLGLLGWATRVWRREWVLSWSPSWLGDADIVSLTNWFFVHWRGERFHEGLRAGAILDGDAVRALERGRELILSSQRGV